jgi:SAM-dependent methyltransferase
VSEEEFKDIKSYLPKTGRVLEIGSYPFKRTKDLMDMGYDVSGVDLNHCHFQFNIKRCDIELEKLPHFDNSFDFVLMMQVLEHLGRNPVFALKEIYRVLKPQGSLFLTTPNFFSLSNIKHLIIKLKPKDNSFMIDTNYTGHIHIYTRNELKDLLELCGFTVKFIKLLHNRDTIFAEGVKNA